MSILNITEFDFSQEHALSAEKVARRVALVQNQDPVAVLHIGVKSLVSWLEVFPSEFALAPLETQSLTAEFRPEQAGNASLAPTQISLFGQYLAIQAANAADLPPDLEATIDVIPPLANCPHCAADLPEGARECRRCGERIRVCPICGTPNTWLVTRCRLNSAHMIRTETDWLASPGGNAAHSVAPAAPLGVHLARRWSQPMFPPTRAAETWEWSAPLAAFGMVIASAIDSAAGCASIHAFELTTGAALWDFDLPDASGLYPDRGAMALSEDGMLYAATVGGSVLCLDAIRGTRRWESKVVGTVYGGVTVTGSLLLVPAGEAVSVLDRGSGARLRELPVGGRLDTAPTTDGETAYIAADDHCIYAFDLQTGLLRWRAETDGAFNAAPIIKNGLVYAATMAGTVYALDAVAGATQWRANVSSQGIAVTPALSPDGLLFVAADDGYVHIVAADTGHLIRSRRISPAPLRTSPVCSGHTVFVGADDGNLYTLDADYTVQRAYETTPGTRLAAAGLALYGDTIVCAATNGVLYVLKATQ